MSQHIPESELEVLANSWLPQMTVEIIISPMNFYSRKSDCPKCTPVDSGEGWERVRHWVLSKAEAKNGSLINGTGKGNEGPWLRISFFIK